MWIRSGFIRCTLKWGAYLTPFKFGVLGANDPWIETCLKFLSKICVSTTIYVSWPNLAKISRCEVAEKSSRIAYKKTSIGDTFEPPPFRRHLADRAQNLVNVARPWPVHVYRLWSKLAAVCRTYSGKSLKSQYIGFQPTKYKLQSQVTNVGDKNNILSWQGSNSTITVVFDVHVKWIWHVLQWRQFGAWAQPTLVKICVIIVPDSRLMTTRKLTSRSFLSCDRMRMATVHVLSKLSADIYIGSRDIDIWARCVVDSIHF